MEERTIGLSIRKPGIMLPKVGGGKLSWTNHQYINLWSADNDKMYESETPIKNGVKTIYDPSPVGFKVPDVYAFKDLSNTGAVWSNGYTLKADNDKEIYFPAGGYRDGNDGKIKLVGSYAMYWASAALIHGTGGPGFAFRALMTSNRFSMPITDPDGFGTRSYGLGVRPVAE